MNFEWTNGNIKIQIIVTTWSIRWETSCVFSDNIVRSSEGHFYQTSEIGTVMHSGARWSLHSVNFRKTNFGGTDSFIFWWCERVALLAEETTQTSSPAGYCLWLDLSFRHFTPKMHQSGNISLKKNNKIDWNLMGWFHVWSSDLFKLIFYPEWRFINFTTYKIHENI